MKTRCPYCKRSYHVEDEFGGQMIPCPGCGQLFRIRPDGQTVFKVAKPRPEPEPDFFEKYRKQIVIGGTAAGVLLLVLILLLIFL